MPHWPVARSHELWQLSCQSLIQETAQGICSARKGWVLSRTGTASRTPVINNGLLQLRRLTHLVLMWFRTSCLAPHLPAHAPASGGVECPRSFALAAMTASGPRAAKRGSMSSGMCASVASCTRSDSRPGVEEMSEVRPVADDVSPRMASFRGAESDAGSWMIKPMQGSTSRPSSGS